MISCKNVAKLLMSDELQAQTWWKRMEVRLHLAMCKFCSRLARQTGTELAHRQMQADLHALPPCLRLKLIRHEQLGHIFARDHGLLQPLVSRHSRSRARARCISTPKLATLTSRILQISPVSSPSTSLRTKTSRWFTGRPPMQPRIISPTSLESSNRSKSRSEER